MLRTGRKWSALVIVLVMMAGWYVGSCRNVDAYIMPAEQLLGLMANNFSRFKTVVLTQSTQLMNAEGDNPAMTFEEKVWIRSPGSSGSQVVSETEGQDMSIEDIRAFRLDIDSSYRHLLVANSPKNLSLLLTEWGIDPASVSLTRLDGIIAYCIGKAPKQGPRLLIEKERFLPLLLAYSAVLDTETRNVEVRFKDYRKVPQGWFPFRIEYCLDGEPVEKYFLLEAKFNVPLPSSTDGR
jgi:hypothetical protein